LIFVPIVGLTGDNIKNIEVFFDTLVIELSGHVLLEKITFNYGNASITSNDVNYLNIDVSTNLPTRLLSSASLTGVSLNSTACPYYGGIWYNETSKKFTTCLLLSAGFSSGLSGIVVPVLYEYDLNLPSERKRIFPTNTTDYNEYIYYSGASANDLPDKELLTYIEPPVITYNNNTNSYFITFIGYVNQYFKLVNYTTGKLILPNVIVTETNNIIVTETGDPLIAV
jgi:hypothetical protein